MKKINLLLSLFVICGNHCILAQDSGAGSLLQNTFESNEGSILLTDGTELFGIVRYNDRTGSLSYESGSTSKSFTARSVAGFEFFDERLARQRVYYSFSYEDPKTNLTRPFFFEVLKEFRTFALLSKVDPVEIKEQNNALSFTPLGDSRSPSSPYTATEISQTETIYIMSSGGEIKPYLRIIEKEVDDLIFDRATTKNKLLDEDLLEQYTSDQYEKLVDYAEKNKLSFKKRNQLLEIIEYYQTLISE